MNKPAVKAAMITKKINESPTKVLQLTVRFPALEIWLPLIFPILASDFSAFCLPVSPEDKVTNAKLSVLGLVGECNLEYLAKSFPELNSKSIAFSLLVNLRND